MADRKDSATIPAPGTAQTVVWWRSLSASVRRFVPPAGVLLLMAIGIVAIFLLDPSTTRFFPRCPFFALTGLKCPGCGTARALHVALHGHFAEALGFNVALPALLALIPYCVAFPQRVQRPAFVWSVLAFVVAWGVARNVLGM